MLITKTSTSPTPIPPPINIQKLLRKAAGSKDPNTLPAFLSNHPQVTLSDLEETSPTSDAGKNCLHIACWLGCIENVTLLLEKGCGINTISTGKHNYGKTPIFYAVTKSREDIVNYLLDYRQQGDGESVNVRIVNNKGQSVYSVACSHFDKELIQRIQLKEDENEASNLPDWLDYSQSHSDGNIYGDLDLRFLHRPLTEDDVVKNGVVNPTTRESRRGNFAKNNPQSIRNESTNTQESDRASLRQKQKSAKLLMKNPSISDEEQLNLDEQWNQVATAIQNTSSWEVFSSLIAIVQFWEEKDAKSPWAADCVFRLHCLVQLEVILVDTAFRQVVDDGNAVTVKGRIRSALSEAIIFCGCGDRHASLVKRIITNCIQETGSLRPTQMEKEYLTRLWNEAKIALGSGSPENVFLSLIKIVIVWGGKDCDWMYDSTKQLHVMLESNSVSFDDDVILQVLEICDRSNNRHASLLKRMLTKSLDNDCVFSITNSSLERERKKKTKKPHDLPDRYHAFMKELQATATKDDRAAKWGVLMKPYLETQRVQRHLSLPRPPNWIDSSIELQRLQSKLRDIVVPSNMNVKDEQLAHGIQLEKMVAFDSEWCTNDGVTELATIQFSVFEDGVPNAWVVDLLGGRVDDGSIHDPSYSNVACDVLRWLFLESDAHIVGFAHRHDLHMLSSYIGEEISVSCPRYWDLQLIAANRMTEDTGQEVSSLPGLKSCCSFFFNNQKDSNSWSLSKEEQCSNWNERPLRPSQLEYAGLDAAVLLVLLAEIARI